MHLQRRETRQVPGLRMVQEDNPCDSEVIRVFDPYLLCSILVRCSELYGV